VTSNNKRLGLVSRDAFIIICTPDNDVVWAFGSLRAGAYTEDFPVCIEGRQLERNSMRDHNTATKRFLVFASYNLKTKNAFLLFSARYSLIMHLWMVHQGLELCPPLCGTDEIKCQQQDHSGRAEYLYIYLYTPKHRYFKVCRVRI
jgi:hypothetical protein